MGRSDAHRLHHAELETARRDAESARDVAQQANRAKDEFLAMLGHELRNPLAPIFTALELMRLRDNEDAASLLAEMLGEIGYDCTIAFDGPRALEIARQAVFDSVLLDIGLPAMDGYEVARHLREMPGGKGVRLVAITGYGQYNDRQRSLEAGFDHHLVKPIDIRKLTGLL